MKSNNRYYISIFSLSILGILLLQLYWLNQFYSKSKNDFEQQANISFEEALKKEFDTRVDTITGQLIGHFMDTAFYNMSSTYDAKSKTYEYIIAGGSGKVSFTSFELNEPFTEGDTVLRRKIAREYANRIKEEDLKNHFVINRLGNLGAFLDTKIKDMPFDTGRVRPILASILAGKNMLVPFTFYLSYQDTLLSAANIPGNVQGKFPLVTGFYKTYKWWQKDEKYVRAMFANPSKYILSKMRWMIIASIVLLLLTSCYGYLLFNAWRKEKKLSVIKDDFINNITHELKTPVATISAAVEALSDFNVLEDKSKAQRYLKHSANELTKLNDLINRVLNISFYESNQQKISRENVDVIHLLKELTESLKLAAQPDQIHIEMKNCPADCVINTDKIFFTQCVSNILQNAVKYADEKVCIAISCNKSATSFELVIEDNGWGIDSKDLPYVFDKFYRGIRKDHLVKGHGLGLYHVKQMMEMQKGSIFITSKKDKGTAVHLKWPA
jgi:two-component system, OmpR family, phosphate regulon sensor histidine kinase PhoR